MSTPLKIGLIGCGNVVQYGHRPALITLPDVELIALADITPARREIGQQWFSLRDDQLYEDYRDLLAIGEIDAVVIAVPQKFRPQIVQDAFAARKHVLSEKPISSVPAVAAELMAAADAAGRVMAMVHNYHFLPEYRQIKRMLRDGLIGDVRVAMLHFLGVIDYPGAAEYQADWRHTMAAGGGILMDMIHAVYLAEWLVGEQAQQVMAFVDAPENAHRHPVIEDLALVQIAFPGCYAAIHMGWGKGVGGVDISGSDGQIRMRYKQYQSGGFNQPVPNSIASTLIGIAAITPSPIWKITWTTWPVLSPSYGRTSATPFATNVSRSHQPRRAPVPSISHLALMYQA